MTLILFIISVPARSPDLPGGFCRVGGIRQAHKNILVRSSSFKRSTPDTLRLRSGQARVRRYGNCSVRRFLSDVQDYTASHHLNSDVFACQFFLLPCLIRSMAKSNSLSIPLRISSIVGFNSKSGITPRFVKG